jgi:hypothetical protein
MKPLTIILSLVVLCSSVILGQEQFPRPLPKVDISQIWHSSDVPEHSMVFNPLIDDIINQTNLDSLVVYVRILSGEDSVWIAGSKAQIQHRVSDLGNDLAADYLKQKLNSYNLEVHDQAYSVNGRNIYAVQSGYLYPEQQYIICAHYDAVADYCADDNASGVAAVLEAARILSHYDFKYTLVYALWDEEEFGMYGSQYYASQARSDQTDIRGVLNMDMIGWDSNNDGLFDIHSYNIANSNSLANLLVITNSLYNFPLSPVIYNPGTWLSDHASFWNYDYGAVLLIEAYYGGDLNPYYHSNEDRIDKFDLTYFHNLSKLSISAIATVIEITEDTLLVAVSPEKGYRTYATDLVIQGIHTNFMDHKETLEAWLSKGVETIAPDSVIVQSNTLLSAFFSIPGEAATGMWDVNVRTAVDGLLIKEYSFEILPSPALIAVAPDTLNITVESGAMVSRSLTISNTGASNLEFKILSQTKNYALQFDGVNDYIEVPNDPSLNFSTAMTIEAWINMATTDGAHTFVAKWNDNTYDYSYIFKDWDGSDKLSIELSKNFHNDLCALQSRSPLPLNTWIHVATTFDGQIVKLYMNGQEDNTKVVQGTIRNSQTNLIIGALYAGRGILQHLRGMMDEIRIWNYARSTQEINDFMHTELTGNESGLAAYWNFNKAAGDTLFDLTINGNHGILHGGAEWVSNSARLESEWLSVAPDSGICMVGATVEVNLYIDARELELGEYSGLLTLSSNDPFNPLVHIPIYVSVTEAMGIAQNLTFPTEFKLTQNYPNPFNPSTTIEFELPTSAFVTLKVYNLLGEEIATLVSEQRTAGIHKLNWDARGLASGVYLYRLEAGDNVQSKKLILMR